MGPEKSFETKVKTYLIEQDAWFVKFFANRMTKEGVPDILACVNGYFVGIEVKASVGRPSELQLHNIQKIKEAGGFAFVLYPSGWNYFKRFIENLKKEVFDKDTMPMIIK